MENQDDLKNNNIKLFPLLDPKSFESEEHYNKARDEYLATLPASIPPHLILKEKGKWGGTKIQFTSGVMDNIIVSFGQVTFVPKDDGTISLSYQYDLENLDQEKLIKMGRPLTQAEIEKMLGDFLMASIEDSLKKGNILFRGGLEEMEKYAHRDNDSKESNT
jgi:hypothetical protein